jgi:aryl-alcohol dehydrogenase-like predicted oxidoreductase
MPTRVPLIFVSRLSFAKYVTPNHVAYVQGGGAFGVPNTNTTRIHTLAEAQEIVDLFMGHGQTGFDTARAYGYGSSEEVCLHIHYWLSGY